MDSLQDYGSSSSSEDEDTSGSKAQLSSRLTSGEKTQTNNNSNEDDRVDETNTPADDSFRPQPVVQRADRRYLNAAPSVSLTTKAMVQQQQQQTTRNSSNSGVKRKHNENRLVLLSNNPTKDVLYQPIQGPANNTSADSQRHLSRYEPKHMQANMAVDEAAFHEQRVEFQRSGRAQVLMTQQGQAAAPQELLRTTLGYERQRLQKFTQQDETRNKVETAMSSSSVGEDGSQKKKKKKRSDNTEDLVLGSDDEVEFGVWGPPSRQEAWLEQNKLTNAQTGDLAPEQMAEREYIAERNRVRGLEEEEERPAMTMDKLLERKMAHLLPPQQAADSQPMEATSTFHGAAEYDYQGRSWTAPPPGVSAASHGDTDEDAIKCFVPKKCVARFGNPNKQGVHRIRLFPGTGHLLLSAGLDGVCQVWSVAQKKLMRSYKGHSAAVRDVQFNLSGTQFVSASFDRYLRLWDVESGEVKQTFSNGKVPYCVQFYPRDDTYFCVGCSDNRIVTYHTETGEITQEYNHHLAPVNAIVFVENKDTNEPVKMVTSSDDKKILVWEYDIGVPIKYISDPTMHSMPCMTMHPSGLHFVGQSLDNTINVIQTSPKIKLLHNKKYSGHIVSGYACDLAFSPDGRFLVSGDGTGALFIWDWKRHKILQKYRAHEPGKPTIGCVWHPLEPSTLFTCSWDGNIKMWQ